MSQMLGQQVVVENVGGAGGMTGVQRVAQAPPDGYTIVLGTVGTHAQNQTLYKRPLYNAATDFTPVALLAQVPLVLISRKDLPVNNLQEFIAYPRRTRTRFPLARPAPARRRISAARCSTPPSGVTVKHVPYRGTGPAMQDLAAGRIDYLCEIVTTALPQIQGGTVKPIAMLSLDARRFCRTSRPPMKAGCRTSKPIPGTRSSCPRAAAEAIVKKLHDVAVETMKTPAVKERLESLGAIIVPEDKMTPEYLTSSSKAKSRNGPCRSAPAAR